MLAAAGNVMKCYIIFVYNSGIPIFLHAGPVLLCGIINFVHDYTAITCIDIIIPVLVQ